MTSINLTAQNVKSDYIKDLKKTVVKKVNAKNGSYRNIDTKSLNAKNIVLKNSSFGLEQIASNLKELGDMAGYIVDNNNNITRILKKGTYKYNQNPGIYHYSSYKITFCLLPNWKIKGITTLNQNIEYKNTRDHMMIESVPLNLKEFTVSRLYKI